MTIKEIAKKANVSLGTVDRVIHDRGKVAKSTKEKVLKILQEVDYKPNFYARGLVLNKSYTIGALLPNFQPGEYWEIPSTGVNKAAKNLSQFGINVNFFYFNQNETASFMEQAKALINSNPDGVILAPVINFEAIKLCAQLNKLNVPFTIIDSKITKSGAISFIGQDAKQSGRLAAKLLSSSKDLMKKFFIVSIKRNENHNKKLQKRIEGFKDYFIQENKLDDVILEELNMDQREKNWKIYLEKILKEKKPDGIYVPSSRVHFIAEILYNSKLNIGLVGNDLIEKNQNFVANGTIDYIIGQRPELQGYKALENLYKFLVTKQEIQSDYYLPLDIATKENVMYYKSTIEN